MIVKLTANLRTGEENLTQLRQTGWVPAVIYGHNQSTKSLAVKEQDLTKAYKQAGESTLVDLTVEGESAPVKVLIHEVQHHPLKSKLLHVDFYKVNMKEKVTAEIPLRFEGIAPAVKNLGGTLLKVIDKLEVECLPADLISEVVVDISPLAAFDNHITVADLKLPASLELKHHQSEDIVAKVERPRTEEELAALTEEVKVDVSAVEVEKKGKEEVEGEATEAGEAKAEAKAEGKETKKESKKEEKK